MWLVHFFLPCYKKKEMNKSKFSNVYFFLFYCDKKRKKQTKAREKTLFIVNAYGIETLLAQSAAQCFAAMPQNLYASLLC